MICAIFALVLVLTQVLVINNGYRSSLLRYNEERRIGDSHHVLNKNGDLLVAFAVYNAETGLDASNMVEISSEIATGIDLNSSLKGIDGQGYGMHVCVEEELQAF